MICTVKTFVIGQMENKRLLSREIESYLLDEATLGVCSVNMCMLNIKPEHCSFGFLSQETSWLYFKTTTETNSCLAGLPAFAFTINLVLIVTAFKIIVAHKPNHHIKITATSHYSIWSIAYLSFRSCIFANSWSFPLSVTGAFLAIYRCQQSKFASLLRWM